MKRLTLSLILLISLTLNSIASSITFRNATGIAVEVYASGREYVCDPMSSIYVYVSSGSHRVSVRSYYSGELLSTTVVYVEPYESMHVLFGESDIHMHSPYLIRIEGRYVRAAHAAHHVHTVHAAHHHSSPHHAPAAVNHHQPKDAVHNPTGHGSPRSTSYTRASSVRQSSSQNTAQQHPKSSSSVNQNRTRPSSAPASSSSRGASARH